METLHTKTQVAISLSTDEHIGACSPRGVLLSHENALCYLYDSLKLIAP